MYKPRVRCYDVNQLSMKFERCLDAEGRQEVKIGVTFFCDIYIYILSLHDFFSAVNFTILSDDYSKVSDSYAPRILKSGLHVLLKADWLKLSISCSLFCCLATGTWNSMPR